MVLLNEPHLLRRDLDRRVFQCVYRTRSSFVFRHVFVSSIPDSTRACIARHADSFEIRTSSVRAIRAADCRSVNRSRMSVADVGTFDTPAGGGGIRSP